MPATHARLATALIFVTPALWCVNYLIARRAPGTVEPYTLAFGRWLVAALILSGNRFVGTLSGGTGTILGTIIGGLVAAGRPGDSILVVDPGEAQRAKLVAEHGVRVQAAADPALAQAAVVVWAVKPQLFADAAAPCAANEQVSDAAFVFTTSRDVTRWHGDYNGLWITAGGDLWATWSDTRTGGPAIWSARVSLR